VAASLLLVGCRPPPSAEPVASPADAGGLSAEVAALRDRPLYTFDETELGKYLGWLHGHEADLARRVLTLARKNIGQPYEIYLLGEFPLEEYDPEPIYCLGRSDCLTFCEHMYAMGMSTDFWTFLRGLQRLRYRDGIVGMLTRNHYTVADWNRNNAYVFEDMTRKLGGGAAAVPLHQVCRRARFFAKFGIGQDIPDEVVDDAYIPTANVPAILGDLRNADFVNIIRGNSRSQHAGHTGMIAIGGDGGVNLLHSARPAVREEPLLNYLQTNRNCLGMKILRLRPRAEQRMRQAVAASPAGAISETSLNATLQRRRDAAPPTARPPLLTWQPAMRLQAFRIGHAAPVDAGLQAALERIDGEVGNRLGIPEGDRAIGVLDLANLRLAMVRPDAMFYAASVPKIGILLAYCEERPELVRDLPQDVRRELGMMIKLSDNDMALKYGRLLGIEQVQRVLASKRYGFYDADHGGGLWYGKHYGKSSPRIADPLHDHSHGATVRQCLRFYLMLEQGRLVSPAACRVMREIFASPALELPATKFVAGLDGRDVAMIRKSGTWRDWHLDTARVEHGDRVYLLAGMTHHPQGARYLAEVAGAIDEHLCGPARDKPFVHQVLLHDAPHAFRPGSVTGGTLQESPPGVLMVCPMRDGADLGAGDAEYESAVLTTDIPFNEALLSWNVEAPPHAGFTVEARVGRRFDDHWSPYLHLGDWGMPPETPVLTRCPEGYVDVDYFRSDDRFDRLQYRVRASARGALSDTPAAEEATLRIACVAVALSDTTGRPTSVPRPAACEAPPDDCWQRRLPVPYRSQKHRRPEFVGKICSPACVTMMLAYHGIERTTGDVADRCYDPTNQIYGNWPRNIQAAYSFGMPGYLARFSRWRQVECMIADDQPVVMSIRAARGELAGAPYDYTMGHLVVLTGFDEIGAVAVNDPSVPTAEQGQRFYSREDLEQVWMRAKGGTAYVFLAPGLDGYPIPAGDEPAGEPLVDLSRIDPRIVIDIRYATPDNFTGHQLYPAARCLIRESVAWRLRRVQDHLVRQGLGLKVHDGYRPVSVQRKMWAILPDPRYVADPAKGSRHNRGAAVDVTLVDATGKGLEMPTAYDEFSEAAHRDYAGGSEIARRHRELLEAVMTAEGFTGLLSEWWHFDAPNWEQYPVLDFPLDGAKPASSPVDQTSRSAATRSS
jgi:D-alanyl-D-alanine dipeptidase